MSITDKLNFFISDIRKNYSLEIFTEEIIPSTSENGQDTKISRPKNVTELVCTEIEKSSDKIFMGFDIMFNSHKHTPGENQNFLIINAFSTAFSQYDIYDHNTMEFTKDDTYKYVCGKFYTLSGNASNGEFLNSFTVYINNITDICNEYEELYQLFIPDITSQPGQNTPEPKITQFWNKNIKEFERKINANKTPFVNLGNQFAGLEANVQQYIDLGENTTSRFAIANDFYNAIKVELENNKTMTDVWKNHKQKFQIYSTDIENIYKIWLTIQDYFDKLSSVKQIEEYDKPGILVNLFFSEIMKSYNFWDTAHNIDNFVVSLLTTYNLGEI